MKQLALKELVVGLCIYLCTLIDGDGLYDTLYELKVQLLRQNTVLTGVLSG